jgi:hypothetical protein
VARPSSVGQAALRAPHDPEGLAAYVLRYLEWLQVHNYAAPTVQNRQSYLGVFVAWCSERGLVTPREITITRIDPDDYGSSTSQTQTFSVLYNGNVYNVPTVLQHNISVSSSGNVSISVTIVPQ